MKFELSCSFLSGSISIARSNFNFSLASFIPSTYEAHSSLAIMILCPRTQYSETESAIPRKSNIPPNRSNRIRNDGLRWNRRSMSYVTRLVFGNSYTCVLFMQRRNDVCKMHACVSVWRINYLRENKNSRTIFKS